MPARYALSYVPENGSALADFGRTWLGRDIESSETFEQPEVPGIPPERLEKLTHWRRSDGLHGTLKPPFQLNTSASFNGFMDTVHLFAKYLRPVNIPQLEVNIIGKFVALGTTVPSRELVALASECVRAFEGFRLPLPINTDNRYRNDKLTVYQRRMTKHWGYPYVMEEFQFFVPLTDRIENDEERKKITTTIARLAKPAITQRCIIRELTVMTQESRQEPMRIITRVPFGLE